MSPTPADRERLERWWRTCVGTRGGLPPELDPVRVRLLRAVGSGRLPDAGPVHCKVMGFPRLADRVRYLLRAMPARHEARMLEKVRGAGIPAPEVVLVRSRRRLGVPRASMLVTRTLPARGGRPDPATMAATAAALARAGVFHPDLHPDNFLPLADGRCAILDLQSARRRRLSGRARRTMAAKLLIGAADAAESLVEAGMITRDELGAVRARARRLRDDELRRRIRRCMVESTGFEVRRRWPATTFRRRGAHAHGHWIGGGPELRRLWIGDRALEVLEGRPPTLGAFRRAWWPLRGRAVYVLDRHAVLAREARTMLRGYGLYRALAGSRGSPAAALPTPLEAPDA